MKLIMKRLKGKFSTENITQQDEKKPNMKTIYGIVINFTE